MFFLDNLGVLIDRDYFDCMEEMNNESSISSYEKTRLRILYESKILLSNQNDSDYDRYTALCRRLFYVSSSSIVIVDSKSIFVKSVSPGLNEMFSYPRSPSIAENFLDPDSSEIVIVPDMTKHYSYSRASQQKYADVRFVAGVALVVEGVRIGFLGIKDHLPRHDFDRQRQLNLLDIGASVSLLISERRRSFLDAYEIDCLRRELILSHPHPHHRLRQPQHAQEGSEDDKVDLMSILMHPGEAENAIFSCMECDLYDYVDILKNRLQELFRAHDSEPRINYYFSDFCLQGKKHETYPNAFLAIIISSVAYVRSIHYATDLDIRVGYKKAHSNMNHRGLLPAYHRYQAVVDGCLKIEIHFQRNMSSSGSDVPLSPSAKGTPPLAGDVASSNSHKKLRLLGELLEDVMRKSCSNLSDDHLLTDFVSYFDYLDDILRDIDGSSRYTELGETALSSDTCISLRQDYAIKQKKRTTTDCFYDFSIPCLCKC
jgi:hypothetical protein